MHFVRFCLFWLISPFGGLHASHGVAGEAAAATVVDEAVDDGVGGGGVAEDDAPAGDENLSGNEVDLRAERVLAAFEEVVTDLGPITRPVMTSSSQARGLTAYSLQPSTRVASVASGGRLRRNRRTGCSCEWEGWAAWPLDGADAQFRPAAVEKAGEAGPSRKGGSERPGQ